MPARLPVPSAAETVAASLGTQAWAVVIDDATVKTSTSSLTSAQSALWMTPLVFGELPL